MGNDTHGAFIAGKGFSAFIDGIPDKCKHDWDGPMAHYVTDRNTGQEDFVLDTEVDKMPGDSKQEKYENFIKKLDAENKWISGGGGSCSKCGKVAYPDPMEFFEDEQ